MVWRSQWLSLELHVLWRGPASCTLVAGLRVRRSAWALRAQADTHSLASSIVFSVFFIVSFVFVSIIVIMVLCTVQRRWWMAGTA